MALKSFKELCKEIYQCVETLEDELVKNVDVSKQIIINKETVDVKLPLQKVKIYHYSEIIKLFKQIESELKKVLYHEECIGKLELTKQLSGDELVHYCSTENINKQESPINDKSFIRRQRRRAASEVSLYTLSTWDAYLQRKTEEENALISQSVTRPIEIAKRNKPLSKRKEKKFVSSTFNDILEVDNVTNNRSMSIIEDDECSDNETEIKMLNKNYSCSENNLSEKSKMVEDASLRSYVSEAYLEDTKPRIVELVYKKKPDVFDWNNVRNTFFPDSG